jgi:hypothetical protein
MGGRPLSRQSRQSLPFSPTVWAGLCSREPAEFLLTQKTDLPCLATVCLRITRHQCSNYFFSLITRMVPLYVRSWPKELFPCRDFEHFLGPCLRAVVCPRPVPHLGRPELSEAQGKFEGRTDASSCKGKEAQPGTRLRVGEGNSVRPLE